MENDIGDLSSAVREGDAAAAEQLFTLVYDDLRRLARSQRRRWSGRHTLQTTELVHEAFVKLATGRPIDWQGRVHFFATAAKVIRQVLATYAERKRAAKRGGGATPVPFDDLLAVDEAAAEEALAVHEALTALERRELRWGRVLECRIFGGMTIEETAVVLEISPATVKRDWNLASALLYRLLEGTRP